MSKELDELLGQLSINESDFQRMSEVFHDSSIDIKDQKKTYDELVRFSQNPKLSNSLYKLLEKDSGRFLLGLKRLGDSRGEILINVIKNNTSSEDLEGVIGKLLAVVAKLLKGSDDLTEIIFYLSIYFSMTSNFNHTNYHHISIFLKYLNLLYDQKDEQLAQETYSLVLLIIMKDLELLNKDTLEMITSYLEVLIETDTDKVSITNFLNLLKVLELLFPVIPAVASTIYMSESCKGIILNQVSKMSNLSLEYASNQLITIQILKLVSSSCINDECRSFNYNNYIDLVKVGIRLKDENFQEIRILSVLCVVKFWNFVQIQKDEQKELEINMENLSEILIQYLMEYESSRNENILDYSIEGLAYLSLNVSVKQKLRNDVNSIEIILNILKGETILKDTRLRGHSSLIYGILVLLSNLTKLQDTGIDTQKKTTNFLKSFSTPNNVNDNTTEKQETIHNFNRSLLIDHTIVEVIGKLKVYVSADSRITSNSTISQVLLIICMIASNQDKTTRQELVKQGGLNIVLDFLIKSSVVNKKQGIETRPHSTSDEAIAARMNALRSLARILISVNPTLAFNKYDIKTCLPFLVELLGHDIFQYSGLLENLGNDKYLYENVTNLDKYESLLALTNISSVQSGTQASDLRQTIIAKTFDKYLDNFIIDSDMPQIQRASWELISNLILEPALLAKFFNIEKKENLKRLQLLIKLLDSTDESFQKTIAGLLANATSQFDMISQILLQNQSLHDELLLNIINIFENQASDDDLLLRVGCTLLNLVYLASSTTEFLNNFNRNANLKASLGNVLRSNKNREVLQLITEVIKIVKFK